MDKKILHILGAFYIFFTSLNLLILFVIFNWNTTVNYSISGPMLEEINIQILLALFGVLILIASIYLLFKMNIGFSSKLGFIGTTIQLIIYFIPPIIISSHRTGMEPYEFNLSINGYRIISIFYLVIICFTYLINIIPVLYNRFKSDLQETALIRKTILELGTKYPRLQVKEIAETCKIDVNTITKIIREMIRNNEIYAQYFKSTNSVAFNQQANIEEIDKLMKVYSKWEEKETGKI
jgi:hypothetical protein